MPAPNILFIMTDQQRFDTIAALGNSNIYTPNLDRLVRRGLAFNNGYSTCPVCVPARYTIRTGCQPPTTRSFSNSISPPAPGQEQTMTGRCGIYLAEYMRRTGYRTFGIGKFHSSPTFEDLGYDVQLHAEELYGSPETRQRDAFASWIAKEHPEYDFVEMLMGERTEMYYIPQMSPMPAECTVESWAADRAVEQINAADKQPWFGFVSFIGPHPPFAPPLPFNRIYDPDNMPNPIRGDIATDYMDEQLPFGSRAMFAEDISDSLARMLKARYYGEITYIDDCIGRILDAVDAHDPDNTLICFFSDHGDHLGDHGGWQKESFFEASCHIPFLVSWPARLPADTRRDEIVCLADLFGIATTATGRPDLREGIDVLGAVAGTSQPRDYLAGHYSTPGGQQFKVMIRKDNWKYIYIANGGREQLFDLANDPHELKNLAPANAEKVAELRSLAVESCRHTGVAAALNADGDLLALPYQERGNWRCYQFDHSRGIKRFPEHPRDAIDAWKAKQG